MKQLEVHPRNMAKALVITLLLIVSLFIFTFLAFENTSAFQKVEDSPLIFLVIASVIFLMFLVKDLISYLFFKWLKTNSEDAIQFSIMILVTIFSGSLIKLGKWEPMSIPNYISAITLFIGGYYIYQFLAKLIVNISGFAKREAMKIVALMLIGLFLFKVGNGIGSLFLENQKLGYKPLPIFLIAAFSFSFGLANFFNNLRKRLYIIDLKESKLVQAEKNVKSESTRLLSLQASINPHFLYNSLNSIASLAKSDGEKTEKMAIALSHFYQYITNKGELTTVHLADEIELLDHYLHIEKIRFGDKINVEIDIDIDALRAKVPHFLIQPLVENAIKHGFSNDKINIKVAGQILNGNLYLKIYDNGKPFPDEMESGMGLKSVVEKLAIIFPGRHEISFINYPEKHIYLVINKNTSK